MKKRLLFPPQRIRSSYIFCNNKYLQVKCPAFIGMLLLLWMTCGSPLRAVSQAPVISYSGPRSYVTGTAITPFGPTTGGVASPVYPNTVTNVVSYNNPINSGGLAVDKAGDLFYVTSLYGNNYNTTLYKIHANNGQVTTYTIFQSINSIAADTLGNLFVIDGFQLDEIPPAGTTFAVVKSAAGGAAGFTCLTTDATGDEVYGALAGNLNDQYVGLLGGYPVGNGSAVSIKAKYLRSATGIVADQTGNLYIADPQDDLIEEFPAGGGAPFTFYTGPPGDSIIPTGMAIDKRGNIFITSTNSIKMFPAGSNIPVTISTAFRSLSDITFDSSGNIYTVDNFSPGVPNAIIKKINFNGIYSISPSLPPGLNFDINSGMISGTPTAGSPPTNYTITAFNKKGFGSAVVNIQVSSPNADLANLAISYGTLSPAFASATSSYTSEATTVEKSITVTPATSDPSATVKVNSIPVVPGSASAPVTLAIGANIINITVTASDGTTTKTYTLTVNQRAASSNANLSNLTLTTLYANTLGLNVPFSSARTAYSAVSIGSASIDVTPTLSDPNASLTVNGTAVASGTPSASIPLSIGTNTVTVKVTAEDQVTTKNYTIALTHLPPGNAMLNNVSASNAILSPAPNAPPTFYAGSVYSDVSATTITAIAADTANAVIKINGIPVASGAPSPSIPLSPGQNTITILVTSHYGIQAIYTVTITKFLTPNFISATLSDLTLSKGTLSPTFRYNQNGGNFTATVADTVSAITVTPTTITSPYPGNLLDTIWVNGVLTTSGSATAAIPLNLGPNVINIVVKSPYDYNTNTYTIVVTRASSSNATLENLALSSGILTPAFAAGTTNYTASVSHGTGAVTVMPTTSDAAATVKVNGTAVASGSASGPIPLTVGPNTITTQVKAVDGVTTKTYTVTVNVAPSTNTGLASLELSNGTYATETGTNFAASAGIETTSITLTPSANDPTATVTVNGTPVAFGMPSQSIPLSPGANSVTVVVTAQDGVTNTTYTVTITRAPNSLLSELQLSNNTALSPAFSSGTTSYSAGVVNSIASITVKPTLSDATSSLKVNGTTVASGSASASIPLAVGANTITIVATAVDGVTKTTYTLTVIRSSLASSSSSSLAALAFNTGTLSPAFNGGTLAYTLNIKNTVTSLTLTPTAANPFAAVSGVSSDGTVYAPGNPWTDLVYPGLTFTIVVTSQDGTSTSTYTVAVNILPSSNANLINLALSSGTLSPAFGIQTFSYTTSVPNATNAITVTPTDNDVMAIITVNGTQVASGTSSQSIPLSVGPNVITTFVTAEDGVTTRTYTTTVTRADLTGSSSLVGLMLSSPATLSPAFAAGTTGYTANVPYATNSVIVTPTAGDVNATITINGVTVVSGTASSAIPLFVGANTITTVVTANGGGTSTTYTVTITRGYASANANLIRLTLSSGTLSPAFGIQTFAYSANIPDTLRTLTVTPVTNTPYATVTVDGIPVSSGTASQSISLTVGPTVITILVTAQDGITTRTYTVTVPRTGLGENPLNQSSISTNEKLVNSLMVNDGLTVHPGLSPNGDGINDFLYIEGISRYPDNELTIMNRSGLIVFEAKGYDNMSKVFDGHSNKTGVMQLPGTYFYSLQYKAGSSYKYKTGFIILKY